MINYKLVVGYRVHPEYQLWIKKIWQQNLRRYKMDGTAYFDKEGNLARVITTKINLRKIKKASDRFQRKLHKAGKDEKGSITYLLKDGREVSPDNVLFSEDFHKLQKFLKGEL